MNRRGYLGVDTLSRKVKSEAARLEQGRVSGGIAGILGAEAAAVRRGNAEWRTRTVFVYLLLIVAGAGLYGAAMGVWRSPMQALYNLAKFPLVMILTACGNALINGMLAPLLGMPMRFRESFLLILMSFSVAAVILGSFAPLVYFVIWNTPPLSSGDVARSGAYGFVLLLQVVIIAFAGIAANARLFRVIELSARSRAAAMQVLLSWLAVNLILGAQLSWNLRPFIGNPDLPVEFLRKDAFDGNFFEGVGSAYKRISN